MFFYLFFPDGKLKCHCIRTTSGEIISTLSPETKDCVLSRITTFLEPFGDVTRTEDGSLIIHIRFHSLVKLTKLFLACQDGSLAKNMLHVFMTEEMLSMYDPSDLCLDLEFNFDNYVDAAFLLYMHPVTSTHGLYR